MIDVRIIVVDGLIVIAELIIDHLLFSKINREKILNDWVHDIAAITGILAEMKEDNTRL